MITNFIEKAVIPVCDVVIDMHSGGKATCPVCKLCFIRTHSTATTICTTRFLQYHSQRALFHMHPIQVDGGSEFMAELEIAY